MIAIEELLALSLGELAGAKELEAEEHVLACSACAMTLESILLLGAGTRELVRAGRFAFPVTNALAEELARASLITRSYDLSPNAVVACTVGAKDTYTLTTISADLGDVDHVDISLELPFGTMRMLDVPFDAEKGTVRYVARADVLRTLPSGRIRLELSGTKKGSSVKISEAFLEHTAFVP